jgi:hypothetical protein
MVVVDGKGLFLGNHLDSASPAEVTLVERTLATVRVPHGSRPGRPGRAAREGRPGTQGRTEEAKVVLTTKTKGHKDHEEVVVVPLCVLGVFVVNHGGLA